MYLLSKVVEYALRRNNTECSKDRVKIITRNLIKAGFAEEVNKSKVKLIVKTVANICTDRLNPLRKATAGIYIPSCPLCAKVASKSSDLITVKLADDREAKYCIEHNVTIPCTV